MKTTFKKFTLSLVSAALIIVPVSPVFAVTEENIGNGDNTACTRIAALNNSQVDQIVANMATMRNNFTARLEKINTDKEALEQQVAAKREAAHARFEAKVTEMLAKEGLTEDQKQAIETFANSVEQAEATRNTAVDTARNTYREALGGLIDNQQQNLEDAADEYRAAIQAAFNTATTNCGDGTAMTELRASIKTARQALDNSRKSDQIGSQIKEIAKVRNDAIQAANKTFRSSITEYAQTLATALNTPATTD